MSTARTGMSYDSSDSMDTMASSFAPPNVPVPPRNGMIRTYDNHERTFTRPYSAKTVFFYKEGDEYFTGVRVPVSKSRYRNIDSLLDDLNANIQMPFGVRRLTTPMGRTAINDIDQLQHLGKYVASSSKYSRGINLSALERLKKAREEAHQSLRREKAGGQSFWVPTSPSYKQKLRMSRTLGFNVVPSKQVFFVLNGKGRYYRTLLNPLRLPPMDALLAEVSDGLQAAIFRLYSVNGSRLLNVNEIVDLSPPKVIACTRIERPVLATTMLPTIDSHRFAPKSQFRSDASYATSSSLNENGIDKMPRSYTSAMRRNTRRTTGARRKRLVKALPAIASPVKSTQKADDSDSGKANSISSRHTDTPKLDEEPEFAFNEDIEKTLLEAEKHMIAEDDESSDEGAPSLSARLPPDSGRDNSLGSSRSKEEREDEGEEQEEETQSVHDSKSPSHEEQQSEQGESEGSENGSEEQQSEQGESEGSENGSEEQESEQGENEGSENESRRSSLRQTTEGERPSTAEFVGVLSEAERKAEMIRREKLAELDEDDIINDDDTDSINDLSEAESQAEEDSVEELPEHEVSQLPLSRAESTAGTITSLEEILPSDDDSSNEIAHEDHGSTRSARMPTNQSNREHALSTDVETILPSDDEVIQEEGPRELPDSSGNSRMLTGHSNREVASSNGLEDVSPINNEETHEDLPGSTWSSRMLTGQSDCEDILPSDEEEQDNETINHEPRKVISTANTEEEVLPSDDDEHLEQAERLQLPTVIETPATAGSQREEILLWTKEEERGLSKSESEKQEEEMVAPVVKAALVRADSDREEILPSDDEYEERERAAIKIQARYRGYRVRKNFKAERIAPLIEPKNETVTAEEEKDATQQETVDEGQPPVVPEETPRANTPAPERPKRMTYTISIATGNRWGAETEAHMYIQMFGDEQTSRRFYLKQEVDWLQSGETRFRQRHMDSFHVETEDLGTINQVTVGHEEEGYGAGIFIDYVLVTENFIDGRQFVCYCSKWFDSGQVDGKIERTLPVSAFYYLSSVPDEAAISHGRWEFILHNGMEDGTGGTTSNLNIIGYGTSGSSMMHINNDKTMFTVPDTTLIQVDFGKIGDLLKVRFEIDGVGENPDYFLEWVELRDLDTDERIAARIGKWMDVSGTRTKKPQAFREISVFRSGDQPLEIQHYEGKVLGGDMRLLKDDHLQAQLVGDFSDSGVFPLVYNQKKKEYSFKVECVHLGRINAMKIIGSFSEQGQAIIEGFSVLQDIWDKHVGDGQINGDVLAVSATVRESTHCPFRYVLHESKDRGQDEAKNYFKVLTFTDMEGLSTRNKKYNLTSATDDWKLEMSVEGTPTSAPEVSLCSGHEAHQMSYQVNESNAEHYIYEMNGPSIGELHKVRIGMGEMEKSEKFYIKKMRLSNQATKTIIRFPNADTEFASNQVYEFSPVFPDIQPTLNILYTVSLVTTACKGTFDVLMNIIGEEGDSGMRKLDDGVQITEDSRHHLDIDAVDLGPLREIEVIIEGDEDCSWCVDATVGLVDNGVQYISDLINIPTSGQNVRVPLRPR